MELHLISQAEEAIGGEASTFSILIVFLSKITEIPDSVLLLKLLQGLPSSCEC